MNRRRLPLVSGGSDHARHPHRQHLHLRGLSVWLSGRAKLLLPVLEQRPCYVLHRFHSVWEQPHTQPSADARSHPNAPGNLRVVRVTASERKFD